MLEVKNLVKTYRPKKGLPVHAINDISLKIEETGLVFVLGKSGSGKSTLLNLLGGLDKYDSGDIIIKGKSTKAFKQSDFDSYRNTYVGFIFQEYNILDDFSVGANIALAIELQGRKATNEEVSDILETLDLSGFGTRRTNELSGGQKQRIAIARALVKKPEIILGDEPSGALDSETGKQLFQTLKKLSKDKLVIIVSHDRETAETFGDRIIEFSDGKIINDVTKRNVTSDDNTIQYDQNKGLEIKEGYKLTEEDLKMINNYLEKEKQLIITKKTTLITNENNSEMFVPTEEVKTKAYNEDFKMIKSKLPSKMAFKMGASGLNHKKFRLFFTILLSLVAFTLFAVADSMASYNKIDATVNSIIDGNVDYASISKNKVITIETEDYTDVYSESVNLNKNDINKLNNDLGRPINITFRGVYNGGLNEYDSLSFSNNVLNNANSNFYLRKFSGLAEFTRNELSTMGFTITGNMPTNDNEIAITKYVFEHFQTFGYKLNGTEVEANNINVFNDIIGKSIEIQDWNNNFNETFTITAVVDTKFNTERYDDLKNSNQLSMSDAFLIQEFNTVVEYGFHAIGFVNTGYIERKTANNNEDLIRMSNNLRLELFDRNDNYKNNISEVAKLSSFTESDIIFFDTNKTSLNNNEIIISSVVLEWFNLTLNFRGNNEPISNVFATIINEAINNAPSGSDEKLVIQQAWNNEITPLIQSQLNSVDIITKLNYYYSDPEEINGKIVGIFPILNYNDSTYFNTTIVDDNMHTRIKSYSSQGDFKFAIATMPERRSDIREIALFTNRKPTDNTTYSLLNSTSPTLEMANNLVESVAKVFLYIGIGFAVFSALMLSNFIGTSVARKKREIGILRALGARSNDVFKIFFYESLIIAIINFIIASAASLVTIYFINNSLRNDAGLQVTIFNFGIRQIILLLAISVLVAFIASYIPVRGIARKRPVDAISNK